MATAEWPPKEERDLIGKKINRLDGPEKSTGHAKYAYDVKLPDMLYARLIWSPHAHAKITKLDTKPATDMEGVEAAVLDLDVGDEVVHAGQVIGAVAAVTEQLAEDARRAVVVEYEVLPHQVLDQDPSLVEGPVQERESDNFQQVMDAADQIVEGRYGLPVITHCCLESHGQVVHVKDGESDVWCSTQNVSGYADGLMSSARMPKDKIHVDCQYMGGGFGSKFSSDKWGELSTILSRETGRPVKLMLERDVELMSAGNRPSAYADIKLGVNEDGTIRAWQSKAWGSGGMGGYSGPPLPYVFDVPAQRTEVRGVKTNRGSNRAWRAPGHPQGCLITMSAIEDAAAALGMDALEFFKKNLHLTGEREKTYREEFDIAADMIGYKDKAHPRGDKSEGPIKRGLGMSIHTWGGGGHNSNCDLNINPDGSVSAKLGSQDLGTGTRTVIGIVIADTLGIPLEMVDVNIGKNSYPVSGGSGGSTTVGGVSSSSRDAATRALNKLLKLASNELNVPAEQLVADEEEIRDANNANNKMSWKDACGLAGPNGITASGSKPLESGVVLDNSGVGGVQMADVSVDVETGQVRINEFVAVQDCGLIIDMKTARSQVFGAMIMGVTYALFEEAIYDPVTGVMLNPDMEFYRLATLPDVGELKVHMMTGPGYDERGVIGLGEPPVISPGAAISNAVANAIGVRAPYLPLTPAHVLEALDKAKGTAA